jgi:hypothetical protein
MAPPFTAFSMAHFVRRATRLALCVGAACLTLGVMAAASEARATITVNMHTQPAGDTTPFTFHLTGKNCPAAPTDYTFQLRDGESKAIPLCRGQAFFVKQEPMAGWKLVDLQCVATPADLDPRDAFIIDIPGSMATVELSPNEKKACTFFNERVPAPTPPTPPTTGAAPAVPVSQQGAAAPTTPAAQGVSPEFAVSGRAALTSPKRCVERRYTVTVVAGNARAVSFFVNGKKVRTITARRGQKRFTAALSPRAAVDRVKARVSFTSNATPQSRTLNATVRRCAAAAVRPQFTG